MEDESQAAPRGLHGEVPQPEQDIQEQVSRRNIAGWFLRNRRMVGTWSAGYSGTGQSWLVAYSGVVGTWLAGSSGTWLAGYS